MSVKWSYLHFTDMHTAYYSGLIRNLRYLPACGRQIIMFWFVLTLCIASNSISTWSHFSERALEFASYLLACSFDSIFFDSTVMDKTFDFLSAEASFGAPSNQCRSPGTTRLGIKCQSEWAAHCKNIGNIMALSTLDTYHTICSENRQKILTIVWAL